MYGAKGISGVAADFKRTATGIYTTTALLDLNEIVGDDAGNLQEWVDVMLRFEDVEAVADRVLQVAFDGQTYPADVPFSGSGRLFQVLPVTRNQHYSPTNQLTVNISSPSSDNIGYFRLKTLSWRFRAASETLAR